MSWEGGLVFQRSVCTEMVLGFARRGHAYSCVWMAVTQQYQVLEPLVVFFWTVPRTLQVAFYMFAAILNVQISEWRI